MSKSKIFCNHDYSIFVDQYLVCGGNDKVSVFQCSKCGKCCEDDIDGWYMRYQIKEFLEKILKFVRKVR